MGAAAVHGTIAVNTVRYPWDVGLAPHDDICSLQPVNREIKERSIVEVLEAVHGGHRWRGVYDNEAGTGSADTTFYRRFRCPKLFIHDLLLFVLHGRASMNIDEGS